MLLYFGNELAVLNHNFNESKIMTTEKAIKRDKSVLDLLRAGCWDILTKLKATPVDTEDLLKSIKDLTVKVK